MEESVQALRGPWPWWISGLLVGAMVPLLIFAANRHFGMSSSFRHICAAGLPAKPAFFRYDWRKETWSLLLALGVVIGAFVANEFLVTSPTPRLNAGARELFASWHLGEPFDRMPSPLFSWRALASARGLVVMVLGGFLVGFGARWANGCTSGHAIMGLSLRNRGSLVAVIGFFIGGLAMSWLVLPWFLR